jgi:hypothetical protein
MNPNASWLQLAFKVTISMAASVVCHTTTPKRVYNTPAVATAAAVASAALVAPAGNVYTNHNQFYRLRSCGAMAFISDMQIVVQGCPIEKIHPTSWCPIYTTWQALQTAKTHLQ